MNTPHSTTPWRQSHDKSTCILDFHGNPILDVRGNNEQSIETTKYIVKNVNSSANLDDVCAALNSRPLVPEDLATIIASLRFYQEALRSGPIPEHINEIATNSFDFDRLCSADIDSLREEISSGRISLIREE